MPLSGGKGRRMATILRCRRLGLLRRSPAIRDHCSPQEDHPPRGPGRRRSTSASPNQPVNSSFHDYRYARYVMADAGFTIAWRRRTPPDTSQWRIRNEVALITEPRAALTIPEYQNRCFRVRMASDEKTIAISRKISPM